MENKVAKQYIYKRLKSFNYDFKKCVEKSFKSIETGRISDACLATSVELYVCAKICGYGPKLCYGLCEYDGILFYHAWLEIGEIIIDIAIYGNVNFNSYWAKKLETPYIGTYKDAIIKYGKFVFDKDWGKASIANAEGLTLEEYIDNSPGDRMWAIICDLLNRPSDQKTISSIKGEIRDIKIERGLANALPKA